MSSISKSKLNSPLKDAKNLGSAKSGVHHWWIERLTSFAAIPLVIWFIANIIGLAGAPHDYVTTFFKNGINATMMSLLIITLFWHSALGLQVVVEDYVHSAPKKLITLLFIKLAHFALAAFAVAAIAKLHLGA